MTDLSRLDGLHVHIDNPPSAAEPQISEERLLELAGPLLAKVREEEKNKLYPEIRDLTERLTSFETEKNAELEAKEQARLQAEEEARVEREKSMSFEERLEQKDREWNARFEQQKSEVQFERALREKEAQLSQADAYRAQQLRDLSDEIAPEFHAFINGHTPEEIDRQIEIAKTQSANLRTNIEQLMGQNRRPPQNALPPSGSPMLDPQDLTRGMDANGPNTRLTADDIRSMPMEEFIKHRQAIHEAASASIKEHGLYAAP